MSAYHLAAVAAYVVLAIVFAWPLPLSLSTHLTGPPDGDTGIYVWNLWVFRHELIERGSNPYFTSAIFHETGEVNLGLHNYTILANLLALPLLGSLDPVATFNLVYLALAVLSAWAMLLLVLEIEPAARLEAWLAGALFAWSPMLVTRAGGHFSLLAAAPLPLFLLLLLRVRAHQRLRDAVLAGAVMALAFWCDVYYAVYCVLIGAAMIIVENVRIVRTPGARLSQGIRRIRAASAFVLGLGILVVLVAVFGGSQFRVLGLAVSVRSLYTPVLVCTSAACILWLTYYRPKLQIPRPESIRRILVLSVAGGCAAAVLLAPALHAVVRQLADGTFVSPTILWRSSPSGVDLLAFFLPNPNHPLAPLSLRELLSMPLLALEHVASLPLVALGVVLAAWFAGWRPPRLWAGLGAIFVLLSLGPFIHVARVNTYVPGPWAFLRYVPVIGLARTPARMAVLVMLAAGVLFALALFRLRQSRGEAVALAAGGLLLFELLPAPRVIHSATTPAFLRTVAGDTRDVTVLPLPLGIGSGAFSVGRATATPQFHQTVHGKRLMGGGLSRVSERRIELARREPLFDALIRLSEGEKLAPDRLRDLAAGQREFFERMGIGYVIVDRTQASDEMMDAVTSLLQMRLIDTDQGYELYEPQRDAADAAGTHDAPRQEPLTNTCVVNSACGHSS